MKVSVTWESAACSWSPKKWVRSNIDVLVVQTYYTYKLITLHSGHDNKLLKPLHIPGSSHWLFFSVKKRKGKGCSVSKPPHIHLSFLTHSHASAHPSTYQPSNEYIHPSVQSSLHACHYAFIYSSIRQSISSSILYNCIWQYCQINCFCGYSFSSSYSSTHLCPSSPPRVFNRLPSNFQIRSILGKGVQFRFSD